jgi:hypothetical protein
MGSLVNLELLHLRTKQFTPEDLRVLGGMPALETLSLYFPDIYAGPFTVGGHEFQHLKSFSVRRLYQLQFMPGSMPNLKHLDTQLIFTKDSHKNGFNDLGIQYLASLTMVDVRIHAWTAWGDHRRIVEDLEAKLRSLIDAHPNRPALNLI